MYNDWLTQDIFESYKIIIHIRIFYSYTKKLRVTYQNSKYSKVNIVSVNNSFIRNFRLSLNNNIVLENYITNESIYNTALVLQQTHPKM